MGKIAAGRSRGDRKELERSCRLVIKRREKGREEIFLKKGTEGKRAVHSLTSPLSIPFFLSHFSPLYNCGTNRQSIKMAASKTAKGCR